MAVIDVEIVVGGGRDDLPRLRVHPAQDTPLPGVVAVPVAPAHLYTDVGHMDLPVHQIRQDTHGVHRRGVEPCHVGVLGQHLLQHHQLVAPDVVQHHRRGLVVLHIQLVHAPAAVAVVDLGEDGLLSGDKVRKLRQRGRLAVEGLAAQILGKPLVEPQLVVELVGVAEVVHVVNDLLVADTGEIGVPLAAVHVVKPEHHIVVVTRPIACAAPAHIEEGLDLVLAALIVDDVDHLVHFLQPHAGHDPCEIRELGHTLPPIFICFSVYPIRRSLTSRFW